VPARAPADVARSPGLTPAPVPARARRVSQPYAYNALEPHIDEATMKVHHTGHHQAYTDKLNAGYEALAKEAPALAALPVDELLTRLAEVPEKIRPVIRNHGGGYVNHKLFFVDFMAPPPAGDNKPTGAVAAAIDASFGSFDKMKEDFSAAAATVFGSGWAWLVVEPATGALKVAATPNQDTPAMEGKAVILGLDVWEHAYYLKYQSKRVRNCRGPGLLGAL
jgi:Fe-Mn family superoxide dismutase